MTEAFSKPEKDLFFWFTELIRVEISPGVDTNVIYNPLSLVSFFK